MKYIIIFAPNTGNKSIQMIKRALRKRLKGKHESIKVLVWNIKHVVLNQDQLTHTSPKASLLKTVISFDDILFAINRCGPAKKFQKAQDVCSKLEYSGTQILNNSLMALWCNSKTWQYYSLEDTGLFPKTVCFTDIFKPNNTNVSIYDVMQTINKAIDGQLTYPLIFKTERGCRGMSVFKVESQRGLIDLINQFQNKKFHGSFLLQEYLPTNANPDIASYYRVNIIDGKAHSAIKYAYEWIDHTKLIGIKKLHDLKGQHAGAVSLDQFDQAQLQSVVDACAYSTGVFGVDVVVDPNESLRILEFNANVGISEFADVANEQLNANESDESNAEAAQDILHFADAVADSVMSHLLPKTTDQTTMLKP